jgi:hypothetical protein
VDEAAGDLDAAPHPPRRGPACRHCASSTASRVRHQALAPRAHAAASRIRGSPRRSVRGRSSSPAGLPQSPCGHCRSASRRQTVDERVPCSAAAACRCGRRRLAGAIGPGNRISPVTSNEMP